MKKIFAIALLLVAGSSALFAAGGDIFETALLKNFAGAKSIKWEYSKKDNLHKAIFTLNNEQLIAFFDEDASLIATGRSIQKSNLPLLVNRTISQRFGNYKVNAVVEYIESGETSYIISMSNYKAKLIVRAYPSGSSYIFKKEKNKS